MRWLSAAVLLLALGCHPSKPSPLPPHTTRHTGASVMASLVSQSGHSGDVYAAAFTPDGHVLVTGGGEGAVRAWETANGRLLRTFSGHQGLVSALTISRNGQWIVSASEDRTVRAWELATAQPRWTLTRPEEIGRAESVEFSPDDSELAIGGEDGRITIVDPTTGAKKRVIGGQAGGVTALAWGEPGLLAATEQGSLIAWDGESGEKKTVYQLAGDQFWAIQWLADGRIAVGVNGGAYVGDDKKATALGGDDPPQYAKSVTLTADRAHIVVGAETSLRVYRADTLALEKSIPVPDGYVDTSAVTPDGRFVFGQSRGQVATIYDARTGEVAQQLSPPREPISSLAFSDDGTRLYASSGDRMEQQSSLLFKETKPRRITAWDLVLARPHHSFDAAIRQVRSMVLMPDGKTLLAGHDFGAISVWDAATGTQLGTLGPDDEGTHALAVSADGKVIAAGQQYGLAVFQASVIGTAAAANKGLPLETNGMAYSVAISPDGSWAMSGGNTGDLLLVPTTEGGKPRRRSGGPSMIVRVASTPDGRIVLTGHQDGEVRAWSSATGERLAGFRGHTGAIESLAVSADGTLAASAGSDGTIRIWDLTPEGLARGEAKRVLNTTGAGVTALVFRKDGKKLASGDRDGTTRVWDLDSDHVMSFAGDAASWIVYAEDGTFDASPNGVQLASAVIGNHALGLDQFALLRNRPDILLQRLGKAEPSAIDYFRGRWLRRLAKAGIPQDAASDFHVPRATITEARADGKFAVITARCEDDDASLARYQLSVNGVPVLGPDGKTVSGREAAIHERIELVSGPNRIDVFCSNDAGAESFHAEAIVNYGAKVDRDLYVVTFGVSTYKDPRLALGYAAKDARDLANAFAASTGFRATYPKTFPDQAVTQKGLDEAEAFLAKARPDDVVVVFLAGHGIHADDPQATYYFAGYATDVNRLEKTAIPFDAIEKLMRTTAARQKLLLLDTCESGDVDDEQGAHAFPIGKARGIRSRAARGFLVANAAKPKPQVTPKRLSGRAYVLARDRFIYDDLFGRSGTIVLSSSRGSESSYESDEIQQGFFTADLLAALTTPVADTDHDGFVSTDELRAYVPGAVAERSRGAQNPTVDRDNLLAHFSFGLPGVKHEPPPPRVEPVHHWTPPVTDDRDFDGILDAKDSCPDDPEDFDAYQDEDGCPDPDNDQDGILDVDDLCPSDPEDKDGHEDDDGCPDPDNDKDGVLDKDDRCPDVAGKPPAGCP